MVHFVALPFMRAEGCLAPGEAVECPHAAAAVRRAEVLAAKPANAGAVAFSREGNPDAGRWHYSCSHAARFHESAIEKIGTNCPR
jgi:hypothetical protein